MARLLHRLPCHFKELAVLRIEDRGIFGRKAEKLRIETIEPLKVRSRGNVVSLAQPRGVFASGTQVFFG